MAQVPIAGFAVGDPAWFLDGRGGIVQRVEFNPVAGEWQYFVDPLGGMFLESDLFDANPVFDVPRPPLAPTLPGAAFAVDGISESRVLEIVAASVTGLLASQAGSLNALEDRITNRLDAAVGALQLSVSNLEGLIVTQQSEIENRSRVIDEAIAESGAEDTRSFFQRLGGFIRSPFDAIRDSLSEYILSEVRSGLNS